MRARGWKDVRLCVCVSPCVLLREVLGGALCVCVPCVSLLSAGWRRRGAAWRGLAPLQCHPSEAGRTHIRRLTRLANKHRRSNFAHTHSRPRTPESVNFRKRGEQREVGQTKVSDTQIGHDMNSIVFVKEKGRLRKVIQRRAVTLKSKFTRDLLPPFASSLTLGIGIDRAAGSSPGR